MEEYFNEFIVTMPFVYLSIFLVSEFEGWTYCIWVLTASDLVKDANNIVTFRTFCFTRRQTDLIWSTFFQYSIIYRLIFYKSVEKNVLIVFAQLNFHPRWSKFRPKSK